MALGAFGLGGGALVAAIVDYVRIVISRVLSSRTIRNTSLPPASFLATRIGKKAGRWGLRGGLIQG